MSSLPYVFILLFACSCNASAATIDQQLPSKSQALQYKLVAPEKSAATTNTANTAAADVAAPATAADKYADLATTRLSPTMRDEQQDGYKYAINLDGILPHLHNSVVFANIAEARALPAIERYVSQNLMASVGSQFFARCVCNDGHNTYSILRENIAYLHPDSKENLGVEFLVIGDAKIIERGTNICKMEVTKAAYSIEKGDKLIPTVNLDLPTTLTATIPPKSMQGYILKIENGFWEAGKYHAVVISLGARDGLQQGNLLNVVKMASAPDQLPAKTMQKKRKQKTAEKAEFAASKFGEILVYKVFAKVSLAFVLEAQLPLTVLDVVKSDVVANEQDAT